MFSRNLFSKVSLFVVFIFIALTLLVPAVAQAHGTNPSVSPMYTFPPPGEQVMGGQSQLRRTHSLVDYHINTRQLTPGNAFTVWAVIFNNPEHCTDSMCGEDDIFNLDGTPIFNPGDNTFGTPKVRVSAIWAGSGSIATNGGVGNFMGTINEGPPPGQLLFGDYALENAEGAEIHLLLRDHGEASENPATLEAQLTTYQGGCGPAPVFAGCADVQFSVHK